MSNHEQIAMYHPDGTDENAEHYDQPNDKDDNASTSSLAGTDHPDYGATDQTHVIGHMQSERAAMIDAAKQLAATLNVAKRTVSRVIPASSEIVLRTVYLNMATNVRGAIKLCETNQWRSRISIWCPLHMSAVLPLDGTAMFAVGTDQTMVLNPSIGLYPPNAVLMLASPTNFPVAPAPLVFHTVRDLWLAPDVGGYQIGAVPVTQIPFCVQEEFVS